MGFLCHNTGMDKELMRSWGWFPEKSERARRRNNILTSRQAMDKAFWLQKGRCALCHKLPPISADPLRNSLHADHCHKTGSFRGWLCYTCNMILIPQFWCGQLTTSSVRRADIEAYLDLDRISSSKSKKWHGLTGNMRRKRNKNQQVEDREHKKKIWDFWEKEDRRRRSERIM